MRYNFTPLFSLLLLNAFVLLSWQGMARAETPALPKEVTSYSEKVDSCIHFSGEPSSDPERAAQIERAIKKSCPGLKQNSHQLREKYKSNPPVLKELDQISVRYQDAFGESLP